MQKLRWLFLFVIGPLLALVAGSLGVELALISHTSGVSFLGWLLLLAAVSYPVAAVIYYQRRLSHPSVE